MPPGVPVATVAVDGTQNAAHLAARILALKHPGIGKRIESFLQEQKKRYDQWKS
jgi:5-(carboxyamino)imidazole ribonucleotide mutase